MFLLNYRNCPQQFSENANKDLGQTLIDMGIRIGECYAEKKCLEKDLKSQKESLSKRIQDLESENEQLEEQLNNSQTESMKKIKSLQVSSDLSIANAFLLC